MKDIRDHIKKHRLLADGAFGTYYSELKAKRGLAELANLKDPELVKRIHMEYIKAGARLLRTNTFAVNSVIFGEDKEKRDSLCKKAYDIAKDAVKESNEQVFIAACIGPIPEAGFQEHEKIIEEYQHICDIFLEMGTDILLFETFSETKDLLELAEYVKSKSKAAVLTQFCLNRYGYTKMGIRGSKIMETINKSSNIDIVGFNCGIGSGHMLEILKNMKPITDKPIMIMPNAGYPENHLDRAKYLDNTEYFAENLKEISKLGVDILGGCCGTNPSYILAAQKQIDFEEKASKKSVVVLSDQELKEEVIPNEFYQKLLSGKKVIAVELDPPYDASFDGIMERAHGLKGMGADILTFADSPMARPRMDSILTGVKVRSEVEISVMPHVSCRDKNMIALRAQILGGYVSGIRNMLIVTGDPIPGSEQGVVKSVFDFHSIRFMEFVKEMNEEHFKKDPIVYGGACNYASHNMEAEITRMRKKINAGASYFLTQPIFTKEDIQKVAYMKEQLNTKIICGIMPPVNLRNAMFMKHEIAGIQVPDDVVAQFSKDMTRNEAQAVGVVIARKIIEQLKPIADGYYFMLPFNRISLVEECINYI